MKKQAYIIIAIAALLTAVTTTAQAQSGRMLAVNVPFNFVIRDRALPAGEYIFTLMRLGGSDAVKIQSADGRIGAFLAIRSTTTRLSQVETKLVFNRYEDQYFLSQVYGLQSTAIHLLARPRAEEELATNPIQRSKVSVTAHER